MKASSLNSARGWAWIVLVFVLITAPHIFNSIYWTSLFIIVGINILLTSSLRVIWLTGQISIGHAGFMLIGAYTSALLVMKAGVSFWLALPAGGVAAGVVAFALAFPYLRVRGIYFVILTVLTAESIRSLAFNWYNLTGGRTGLFGIPGPGAVAVPFLGKIDFDVLAAYYYIVLAVVAISLLILYLIEKSRFGFTWRAIKQASDLAGTVGINVIWFNAINFVIACFFAGIAGSLFAHFQRTLSAWSTGSFGVPNCITLLVYMVVGGERRFVGPIIGVLSLTLISEFTRSFEAYQSMFWGGIGMIIVIAMPEGLVGLPDRLRRWKNGRSGPRAMDNIGSH